MPGSITVYSITKDGSYKLLWCRKQKDGTYHGAIVHVRRTLSGKNYEAPVAKLTGYTSRAQLKQDANEWIQATEFEQELNRL